MFVSSNNLFRVLMAPAEEGGDGGSTSVLSQEIAAAVEASEAADAEERDGEQPKTEEPKGEEAPKSGGQAEDDEEEAEEPEGEKPKAKAPAPATEPDQISDDMLERAVRCGFSIAQAKQFPNGDLLSAACDRAEAAGGDTGSQPGAGEGGEGDAPASFEDLLSKLPKLDPEDYDESIVNGFEVLKDLVTRQHKEIESLRGGRREDFLTTKLESVKDFTKGDPAKVEAVRKKFTVLKAGYGAAGEDTTDEAIFEEAAQLVLGSDMKEAKAKSKASSAKKRSGQVIQRAKKPKPEEAKASVDDEIAAKLDKKFFAD